MLALIDHRAPNNLLRALETCGIRPLLLPSHPALPHPVAAHPDMNLFFAQDRILCTKEYVRIAERQLAELARESGRTIDPIDEEVGDRYPLDIRLNAAPVGEFLFCHPTYVASKLKKLGYRTVPVRQGYAKCATIPVGDRALITADPSIAREATAMGLDVLKVSPAHIDLQGYDTGFLGGATSYTPYQKNDRILFCGDLWRHPDADKIEAFCNQRHVQTVSLTNTPLTDLGTVFLI